MFEAQHVQVTSYLRYLGYPRPYPDFILKEQDPALGLKTGSCLEPLDVTLHGAHCREVHATVLHALVYVSLIVGDHVSSHCPLWNEVSVVMHVHLSFWIIEKEG